MRWLPCRLTEALQLARKFIIDSCHSLLRNSLTLCKATMRQQPYQTLNYRPASLLRHMSPATKCTCIQSESINQSISTARTRELRDIGHPSPRVSNQSASVRKPTGSFPLVPASVHRRIVNV
ncbi:hypothetical protein RB213_014980, partial [Colletotrichum asianum]